MLERRKTCKKYFRNTMLENPNPGPIFFAYVKLLISLLNGALFRLGENFSLRGYGAKFFPRLPHQLSKHMVGTPHGKAGLGKFCKRWICRKHNGRATKSLQKVFFGIFLRKPEPRDGFFCLSKTAHFLIKRCTFSARETFFGPGLRGEILGHGLSPII